MRTASWLSDATPLDALWGREPRDATDPLGQRPHAVAAFINSL